MHIPSTLFALLFLTSAALAQTPVLVKDINPGSGSGFPDNKEYLVAIDTVVYFAANDGIHGPELWRSDGTEAGTYMVKDIRPDSLGSAPVLFHVLGSKVLFIANDGVHGDELWSSDGTEAGTILVKDINPGTGHSIRRFFVKPRDRKVVKDFLFFGANTGTDYGQLWRSDGTEQGTVLVSNVCPDCTLTSLFTGEFGALNDTLYLVAGGDLWRSDGTTLGTQIVLDNADMSTPTYMTRLTGINGLLYLSAGNTIDQDLWVSDGTKAGTRLVKEFTDSGTPRQFTALAGRVFFISDLYLWSTDGTEAGTRQESFLVMDYIGTRKSTLFVWKNELYYRAIAADNQSYIYKTDGSPNGEVKVFTQNFQPDIYFDPIHFVANDDYLFYDAVNEIPLAAGIAKINSSGTVKEITPVNDLVEYLFIAGDNLFFRASNSSTGNELWKRSLKTSAVSDFSNSLALSIYPTFSADGIFHLDYAGAPVADFDISVFDALGRLSYRALQSPGTPLRLSALPAGAYFVRVTAERGQVAVQKIIKE